VEPVYHVICDHAFYCSKSDRCPHGSSHDGNTCHDQRPGNRLCEITKNSDELTDTCCRLEYTLGLLDHDEEGEVQI
jgi:hypothetical protein